MFRAKLLRIARQPLLRPGAARSRSLHTVPELPQDFSAGVPDLLSGGAFTLAWTRYQSMLIQKLNELTVGTELEQASTLDIIAQTARKPLQAAVFNHASMAHNNHFFFRDLAAQPTPIPRPFKQQLEESFGSMETLRREMLMTANAMFGPGFVWLVMTGNNEFAVLPTYLAGSPYPQAHWRTQDVDMNTTGADRSAEDWLVHSQARGLPDHGKMGGPDARRPTNTPPPRLHSSALPPGGAQATPLLCVNTWQHVWLPDYGFEMGGAGGKRDFLEKWWGAINWEAVAERAGVLTGALSFRRSQMDRIAQEAQKDQIKFNKPDTVVRGSQNALKADLLKQSITGSAGQAPEGRVPGERKP